MPTKHIERTLTIEIIHQENRRAELETLLITAHEKGRLELVFEGQLYSLRQAKTLLQNLIHM